MNRREFLFGLLTPVERSVLVHEHVMVDFIGAGEIRPGRYDPDEVFRVARPKLEEIRRLGCRRLLECTPNFLGRDAKLMARLSDATGIEIWTNTGLYGAASHKFVPAFAQEETQKHHGGEASLVLPDLAASGALNDFLSRAKNPRRAFQEVFGEAVSRWTSGEHDEDYTESFAAFRGRVSSALRHLREAAGETPEVWVFTSGGAISAVVQELLAIPDSRIFDLNWTLVNTGVTKIIHRPDRASLSYVNSHAHLERLKRPELITYR